METSLFERLIIQQGMDAQFPAAVAAAAVVAGVVVVVGVAGALGPRATALARPAVDSSEMSCS
jgi:hypothetical protein